MYKGCKDGKHSLIVIYSVDAGWNEEHIVRWCENCGSIVVDRESDNRNFGRVMKMRFPAIIYRLNELVKENKDEEGQLL